MSEFYVTELGVYPIKSCAQNSVDMLRVDGCGPENDRRWMLVDESGRFLTQRKISKMVFLKVAVGVEGLFVVAPGVSPLVVPFSEFSAGNQIEVEIWSDKCLAQLAGEDVNRWFTGFLGVGARLVFMPRTTRRLIDARYARNEQTVSFADGFPLLLTTEASLRDLNSRLSSPIPMKRFRPNIVVNGDVSFAEDGWSRVRVGNLEFMVSKPCSRCVMPTINTETGVSEPEVFRVLKSFRQQEGNVYFGQNLIPCGQGVIKLGDKVEVAY